MVATLQSRKEALEAKIKEKTAELKQLCLQEREITGILPPETPLEPGETLPRRLVKTSFSFPQNLISGTHDNEDDALNALELECRVQKNIAEAALSLANDASANKGARKKHRLMYRQSQRKLAELETRLKLLKQGKPQTVLKQKKPRPNTTSVDHAQFLAGYYNTNGMGVNENDWFTSLQRNSRSSGSSHSSTSLKLSTANHAFNNPGLPEVFITPSRSHPNIQGEAQELRRSGRREWDSQSAAGTLLPNQTYPDHSLIRAQSLGRMDSTSSVNRLPKEKEWYETSLDAAPSPPLRTSSKLPTTARLMYHMQEMQIRDAVNRSLNQSETTTRNQLYSTPPQLPHPSLSRTRREKQKQNKSPLQRTDDAVYIDIPEDNLLPPRRDGSQTPTTPYFHSSPGRQPGEELPGFHPPHAITQEEIQFDTVVPFESPQNHTVVQAGKWQPYREVTKPFEMSDFYKYSTKFRAHRASVTPSPAPTTPANTLGLYQPLQPLTCQPVERRVSAGSNYFENPQERSPAKLVVAEVRGLCYKKVPRPGGDFKIVGRREQELPSLAEQLAARIRLAGPISVADYMRAVLTHPRSGYYMQGDVFGAKGDFITSPEISQIFGEMIGVWILHELRKIGNPRPLQLVECGPGRGTLSADVLRTISQLANNSLTDVSLHLVEISDRLASIQARSLGCTEIVTGSSDHPEDSYQRANTCDGVPIFWYRQLEHVPCAFSVYLAHEFFDALPIYKFQVVDGKFQELLVTTKSESDFELVLSNSAPNPAILLIDKKDQRRHVEVCLEGAKIAADLSRRIEEDGGFALIIDYGHNGEKEDTFRAFRNHSLHDPFEAPGTADLTADVDFSLLTRAAENQALIFGPVKQKDFLLKLGIEARLRKLVAQQQDPHIVKTLQSGVKKILEEMDTFKVIALFPKVLKDHLVKYPVAGFTESYS